MSWKSSVGTRHGVSLHLIANLALLVLCSTSFATERACAVLLEHKNDIIEASRSFSISPRLLASIVFAEHSLNVKPGEEILDKVLALSGYNASVGIAQIKVETARWMLAQLANPSSVFYDERSATNLRRNLSYNFEGDISAPNTSLLFATAYVAMIVKLWSPLFAEVSFRDKSTGIVATLYSLGLARADGSLRQPHNRAAMNRFGEVAQSFFDSFDMREAFAE